jgi:hypothetical protein
MRKKAPVLQSIQSPRKRAGQASPCPRRQAPAAPLAAAIRPNRRYGVRSGKSRLRQGPDQGSRQADLSAPLIPLTLRAMPRTSPRARNLALPVALLLSVLAVLAFACAPALAHAEEATGPQYESEIPNLPQEQGSGGGGGHNNGSSGGGPGAGISNSPNQQGSGGGNTPGGGGSHTGQGSQGPAGGSGSPGAGSGGAKSGKTGLGEGKQVANPIENASSTSEDESSSPLVPILIAIAVLAAISIGAFYYRQRRQGAGSSVSPKAS